MHIKSPFIGAFFVPQPKGANVLNNPLVQIIVGAVATGAVGGLGYWLRHTWRKIKALNALVDEPHDVENDESDSPREDEYHAQFEELKELVKTLTYPIQPDSNGGKSLSDAIALIHGIKDDMTTIKERQVEIGDIAVATKAMLQLHIDTKNAHI